MRAAIADVMRKLGGDAPPVTLPPPVPVALQPSRTVNNYGSSTVPMGSDSAKPPLDKWVTEGAPKRGPSPPSSGPKPSSASPKKAAISRRSPSPVVQDEEGAAPLFSTPILTPTPSSGTVTQPLFIKSTRRRDASTGKLLPLPAQPPEPAEAVSIGSVGSGPVLRPSTVASIDAVAIARTIGLQLSTESHVHRPPSSGAMTERTLYLQPDTFSPRFVSDKTAELRPRPTHDEKASLTKFRIPPAAKSQIRKDLVSGGTSSKLLAHKL